MPTDTRQTFPEESDEAANLFPFSFSAPLHCLLPLLPADGEVCMADSAYTWPPDPFNHNDGCWELSGGFLGRQQF